MNEHAYDFHRNKTTDLSEQEHYELHFPVLHFDDVANGKIAENIILVVYFPRAANQVSDILIVFCLDLINLPMHVFTVLPLELSLTFKLCGHSPIFEGVTILCNCISQPK